ncbi:MAG: heavy metal translocating P-type ATPase [Leptolyngbyaceae bacterium]|nr:heavy metal translocating P-type ATPase [Leptolyngbyaceae bacterium]
MQLSSKLTDSPTPALQTLTLDVRGMKCAGCVKAVEDQLTQQPGVVSACVNLVTEVATVECEPSFIQGSQLAQVLTEAGFPSQVRPAPGWQSSDPDILGENQLESAALTDLSAQRRLEMQQQVGRVVLAALLLVASGLGHLGQVNGLPIPGLHNIWLHNIWFHWGLATLALVLPGRSILVDGWRGLRRNSPNMNTLVSLGTLAAYGASVVALLVPSLGWECFFDEPVMLIGFILLGRTLEQQARSRAASAFQALVALQPRIARLIQDQTAAEQMDGTGKQHGEWNAATGYLEIPADRVQVGQWLQVLPGDKIPVDGEVVIGQTTVDEAMLTGEAFPVLKQPGDTVTAGTLNQSGAIALRATRTGKDTTLAQIIALVETAQTRKAPIQRIADTVAGYFTYTVLGIATLTFGFWYFAGTHIWPQVLTHSSAVMASDPAAHHLMSVAVSPVLLSLKLAIAVLVVACPCALGLATPTALLVGSSLGAEQGLLIRGGDVLEKVHHLDTVIFDKTGTLTTGQPTVTDCIPFGTLDATALLQIAATVESGTRHPLAIAIQQAAQQQGLPLLNAQHFQTEPGFGVTAVIDDQPVLIGTGDWLQQQGITLAEGIQTQARALALSGKTVVYVAVAGEVAGLIAVSDRLRPDAVATVAHLKKMGLRVLLLTGDQAETAIAIAQPLGLESTDILAGIRPDGKAEVVSQLQQQGHRVAMVGDGTNDAPALAQADVGIALHSGTDVAIETAAIVLMRMGKVRSHPIQLMDVVKSIQLSRSTFNKIRQNLFWALAYNVIGIPVAAGILLPSFGLVLSPAVAALMMAFSSVSVVLNSLLLRHTVSWNSTQ